MTPLHNIQKDRGCTVGPDCERHECSCRRTVRLVLEGVREPSEAMRDAAVPAVTSGPYGWGGHITLTPTLGGDAFSNFRRMIDTALKEVG